VQAVQSNSFTNNATSPFMSEDVAFYTADLVTDKTQPPSVRATSWVLNEDPRNPAPSDPWLVLRCLLLDERHGPLAWFGILG